MRYKPLILALLLMQTLSPSAPAQETAAFLNVTVHGIADGQSIPEKYASCATDGKGASRPADNVSPQINWSGAPDATRSYTVIVVDKDVPAHSDAANKNGETIVADVPRKDFYHWVFIDIPASTTSLAENSTSPGIAGRNDMGARSKGANGYDGPCPPWNDERLHHYHFQVYALDVPSLGLTAPFTGKQAQEAMKGHILAQGEVVGTYTTHPKKKKAA